MNTTGINYIMHKWQDVLLQFFSSNRKWREIFREFVQVWKLKKNPESQFANKETDLQFVVSLGFVSHCFPLCFGDKKWHWKRWSKENITSHIFRSASATALHPHIYTSSEFGPLAPTRKAFAYALLSTSVNMKSFLGYSGVKIVPVSVLNKEFRRFLFGFNYDSLSYRSEGCWLCPVETLKVPLFRSSEADVSCLQLTFRLWEVQGPAGWDAGAPRCQHPAPAMLSAFLAGACRSDAWLMNCRCSYLWERRAACFTRATLLIGKVSFAPWTDTRHTKILLSNCCDFHWSLPCNTPLPRKYNHQPWNFFLR